MAASSISAERSRCWQIGSHDNGGNQSKSSDYTPRQETGYRHVRINASTKPLSLSLRGTMATVLSVHMFAEPDLTIQCQCRCFLIPLIIEGEFICLLCWQLNGYSAICLRWSLASVVLPIFHAWLIGRALEGRLWRLQGHMQGRGCGIWLWDKDERPQCWNKMFWPWQTLLLAASLFLNLIEE